jgi:hypothetical protein
MKYVKTTAEEINKQMKRNRNAALRKKRLHWAMLCLGMFVFGTGFGMSLTTY